MVQKETDTSSPRPRGRPRAYDPGQAIERAAEVFWKAGYAATSLDDLVAATGMNRPSLYAAFGDKRALYLKTLDHYRDRNRALAAAAVADDPPLRVLMRRIYAGALDLYLSDPEGRRGCYTLGTATTVAAMDDDVRAFLAASFSATDRFFAERIRLAQARGEIAGDADADVLAACATATLHTLAVRSRAGAPRAALDRIAEGTVTVVCGQPTPGAGA